MTYSVYIFLKAKQDDSFPPLLKSFENKVFNITLEINYNNIKKGSRVYDAFEIGDKIESGGNFDPEEELPSDLPSASTVNVRFLMQILPQFLIISHTITILTTL